MSEAMSKEQLLREFADAYEEVIRKATEATREGIATSGEAWGPRELVAHLAGWEVMATVRIPAIVLVTNSVSSPKEGARTDGDQFTETTRRDVEQFGHTVVA